MPPPPSLKEKMGNAGVRPHYAKPRAPWTASEDVGEGDSEGGLSHAGRQSLMGDSVNRKLQSRGGWED